ncbi:heat repeat-containing protein 1 [Plakobranchus ocellatus]|uniref:HEAT repeat-containing protein 1 n=1 Tax=Plakobranchus ocellatus TaxID=259542 RepID=A0AAV3YER7_9GAST|nr:heat repeat-containing protein 1 [Plakobranchus ocellatus]
MATSLAAQLKKLAVPETQNLLTRDFKQASFLYDDHEAAEYPKQHFYNIGVNGLQQLIAKDKRFAEFEQNLFSQSSQSLQRYVQTAEVNQHLDVTINKFLLRLSSYMQLREAHKAMEWMVHRYNVHLRNVDTFMMCMLPYHNQQPFVMALQLLRMNSNEAAKWRWLEPVKKGGTFLPRQTLVTHCRSAKGFLGFMCDMLSKHIEANTDEETGVPSARHLQRVLSFFTQTVLGVLVSGPATESTVSTLLPVLTTGLKSHDLPDHIVSSYMILSQLFLQSSLAERLLQSLLNVIAKNMQPNLARSAITVIVIMFQKQTLSKVTKKSFRYLVRQPSLASILREMSQEANTDPFLGPFVATLTRRALKEAGSRVGEVGVSSAAESSNAEDDEDAPATAPPLISLLVELMTTVELNRSTVIEVARIILIWFSEERNVSSMDVDHTSLQEGPFRIFKLLENKYSLCLDAAIAELSSAENLGKKMKKTARRLFKLSVETAHKTLMSDPGSNVTICLHHRQDIVRQKAVETLLEDSSLIEDKSSVQSTLALKLQDDSPLVVQALLKEPEKLWAMFDDKELLYTALLKSVTSRVTKSWKEVHGPLLQALCCVPPGVGNAAQGCAIVLSFLVVCSKKGVELACTLLESKFASDNKLLSHLVATWLPMAKEAEEDSEWDKHVSLLYSKLVDSVKDFLVEDCSKAQELLESVYNFLSSTSRPAHLGYLILSVTTAVIRETKEMAIKTGLQRMLATTLAELALTHRLFGKKSSEGNEPGLAMSKTAACLAQLQGSSNLPLWELKNILEEAAVGRVGATLKGLNFWSLAGEKNNTSSEGGCSTDKDWLHTVTTVVNLLLELRGQESRECVAITEQSFASLFKVFSDKKSVVKFLCMVWMSDSSDGVTAANKARLLQFARAYLASLTGGERKDLLSETSPFVPCMLILLSNEFETVREIAFDLLALVVSSDSRDSSALQWFSQNLLRFRQEVTKDCAFLSQVVKTLLEDEDKGLSPPSPKKRRKSPSKPPHHAAVMAWLLEVVCDQGTPGQVKRGLLTVLHKLDTVESFLPLVPLLKSLVNPTLAVEGEKSWGAVSSEEKDILQLLLKHFTPAVAPVIDEASGSLEVLLLALRCRVNLSAHSSVQLVTVEQLRGKFMAALSIPARKTVVAELLTLIAASDSTEVVRNCRKVIKHMTLEASIVIEELKTVLAKASAATVREAKRQKLRDNENPKDTELETLPWKRITVLLEMLQSKKKLKAAVSTVPVAFHVLGRVLELEDQGSCEYLKQLLLGLINFVCSRHWEEGADEVKGEHLNMDLIVQCIRSSDNAHTHHQALLLLSSAAKIAPSLLLHNMMTVFTFMGANILRQDDSYSFHVIGKILDNVIPALIMACEEKSRQKLSSKTKKKWMHSCQDSVSSMMTVVLRVFVDAVPHIPSHRRMILFEKLVQVVGADLYLWRLILLYIESVTVRGSASRQGIEEERDPVLAAMWPEIEDEKTSGPLSASDLEFLTGLTEPFSSSQLLVAFQQALAYVLALPEEKSPAAPLQKPKPSSNLEDMSAEDMAIFSVPSHSPKQLRHFKFATVFAFNHLITSQHIVAQLSETDPTLYLSSYQRLLETCLQWIGQVSQSLQHHIEDVSRRYWKLLLHKSHDLLDTLVNLLPDSMFFEVVSGLMAHSLTLVQRRAMELLNSKLLQQRDVSHPNEESMLVSMVEKLHAIASSCLLKSQKSTVSEEEQLVNGQTALYSLKILCRLLGEAHHQQFIQVLQLCVKALTIHNDNGAVSSSAMLCIAEVVSAAKTHVLENLGSFMPLLVSQLQSDTITQHDVVLLATITSLHKVIEALPLFLSPYLQDIFIQVCIISSLVGTDAESHKPMVNQKLKLISTTLATATPTRTFLPVIEKSFVALEDKLADCAESAMSMLKEHIGTMSREDLGTFSQDLLKFFFSCFDLRVNHTQMSEGELDVAEGFVIEAFITLVFKLSEAQFKPMLLQIYSWATQEDASHNRVLFFYRLCDSLAEKLKSLFTLFAGHILKHSAQVLDSNNNSKSKCRFFGKGKAARLKSCKLVCYVLDCLQKTFAHDTEGFMNKERFDIVMQPLVDQLENELGKPSASKERAEQHVVPSITSLAAAARDDSLWKDLNYQILLKTRHQNPQVRLWALAALDAFHKQLGEDYTQLVPEAIPFLAELMEDESDEVEKYTQKVLAAMEVSVGENLQEYF